MHNDQKLLNKLELNKTNMKYEHIHHDIYTSSGYISLFNEIKKLCILI